MENWKASFLRAGVYCEKEPTVYGDELEDVDFKIADPHLEREVETIRNLVKSYVKIVSKTFKDLVPKYVSKLMINSLKEFIVGDTLYILLNDLYSTGDQSTLMDMSAEEEKRKEDILKLYSAIVNALQKINEVCLKTQHVEMLPPIRTNDFGKVNSSRSTNDTIRNHQSSYQSSNSSTVNYDQRANRPSSIILNGNARNNDILKSIPGPQQLPTRPNTAPRPSILSKVVANGSAQQQNSNLQNELKPALKPSRPVPSIPEK